MPPAIREVTLDEFVWMQIVEYAKIFIRFVERTVREMGSEITGRKIKAGEYVFREDLVREMDYMPAEDQSGKLIKDKDRQESELLIYFVDGSETTTLKGEEADIAWRKYTEDAR